MRKIIREANSLNSFGQPDTPSQPPYSNKVFVATVFKSGTKLLEHIIEKLTGLTATHLGMEVGSNYESAAPITFEQGKFFIWHNVPSDAVKTRIRAENAKPIFLIRNIYDLVVSQYFHFADDVDAAIGHSTGTADYFASMSRDEGISLLLCGATSEKFNWHGFGYYLRQIQEMLRFSKEYPCHVVVYDRMVLNKPYEIERLAGFLGIEATQNVFNELLDSSTLGAMRKARIASVGSGKHFRKGTPGDHVNVLALHHYHIINHLKLTYAPDLDALCEELGFNDVTVAAQNVHAPSIGVMPRNSQPTVSQLEKELTPDQIRVEANRLSLMSGRDGGPNEGWQYPFDLGHGIVTRTYTEVQAEMHPWRRNVLLNNLDLIFAGRYHELSVLDLGACEGAMALALWERGVRDITCIEARASNVEKARFVFRVKKADILVVEEDVLNYLGKDQRHYDLVLFMGLLYHLLDPFQIMHLAAQRTCGVLAMETVIAKPHNLKFDNVPHYSPSPAGFFIRHDSVLSNTAGLNNLELWPNREGLEILLGEAGFTDIREMDYGQNPISWYATEQRIMLLASHQ